MAFTFSFSGDGIDPPAAPEPSRTPRSPGAFPVPNKPQLPPTLHPLSELLSQLPSKIVYSVLDVQLDDGTVVKLPRRELWDVRVQIMAEDRGEADGARVEGQDLDGLGKMDVKTGVYEGGFKSWESSVDLVKTLAAEDLLSARQESPLRVIELGCGTALPTLALFQWTMTGNLQRQRAGTAFIVADYNPTVLQLVTLPNLILIWALSHQHDPALNNAFDEEAELELSVPVVEAFQRFLADSRIDLSLVSGGWSEEFVRLLYSLPALAPWHNSSPPLTLLLGAETIYSPFALRAFTETAFAILGREAETRGAKAVAYVGAKRLYFGVGGSLDDFIQEARSRNGRVSELREESEGVRRAVVRCELRDE